jgi:hypothetical protein
MEGGNLRGEVSLCGMYVLNFYNLTGKEERRQVRLQSNSLNTSLFAQYKAGWTALRAVFEII